MYQLVTTDDLGGLLRFPLVRKRTIIGRDPSSDIQLFDEEISRHHAKIYIIDDAIYIKDNKSTNGVFVNNFLITKITPLKIGDEVIIGSYQFHLRQEEPTEEAINQTSVLTIAQLQEVARNESILKIDPETDESVDEPTAMYNRDELVRQMYKKKTGMASFATLEVLFGPDKGRKFMIAPGSYVIGRSNDSQIHLDDPRVSSHHARLEAAGKQFGIEDLNSLNGSLVNNRTVGHSVLGHNDSIMLGNTKLRFQLPTNLRPKRERSEPLPSVEQHSTPVRGGLPTWLSVLLLCLLAAGLVTIAVAIFRLFPG
ncbi:MAG: FHA domain-containing protein [Candidatus Alcyoniella australis]|nr:FHA domain-containing protein [Candidatus Alcyoniella australis]